MFKSTFYSSENPTDSTLKCMLPPLSVCLSPVPPSLASQVEGTQMEGEEERKGFEDVQKEW